MANECDSENYVAEIWRVLVSEATIPPFRIIIRAATYTQYELNRFAVGVASAVSNRRSKHNPYMMSGL